MTSSMMFDTKTENYIILVSLKSETTCKLINRIPVSHLLMSSLPGLALKLHVESHDKPGNSTSVLEYVLKRVSFESKDCTKELKLECTYSLGQTS